MRIETARLTLTSLAVDDAEEMVAVLADPRLYTFIGGRPAGVDELRERYRRMVAGSPDPEVAWLNWIVRLQPADVAVGTVQSTISPATGGRRGAVVAWVIGTAWQGRGIATEAAGWLIGWLQAQGIDDITAHIHRDHLASGAVARHCGLHPTDGLHRGEIVWRLAPTPNQVDGAP